MARIEQHPAPDRSWSLLLAAVERLHDRGLTGIRALPYFGPVGYWRIETTTAVNLPSGVNLPARDEDAVFRESEGSFPRIGELVVSPSTTADDVADEILRRLGSPGRRLTSTTANTVRGSPRCVIRRRPSVRLLRRSRNFTTGGGVG